jgi:predicted transcriptional regulator
MEGSSVRVAILRDGRAQVRATSSEDDGCVCGTMYQRVRPPEYSAAPAASAGAQSGTLHFGSWQTRERTSKGVRQFGAAARVSDCSDLIIVPPVHSMMIKGSPLQCGSGAYRFNMNRNEPLVLGHPMAAAFTVRLDEAVLRDLDRLAEKTDRSRNWLVSQAVQEYASVNAWQLERIEEGIAAADRGDFASEAEVARVKAKFGLQQ